MEKGYEFLVDSREKEKIVKAIVQRKGIPHRITALAAGDFALRKTTPPVETIVGIERKSVQDLVQSIQSQRLFNQCERMTRRYRIPMLFISGSIADYLQRMGQMKLRVNTNVIYGSISSLMVRGGIQVAWFPDDVTLVDVAYRVCVKVSEGKYGTGLDNRPKYLGYSPKQVLMQVPGVNSTVADRMLAKFGSLRVIAVTNVNRLSSVDGIGDKTAEKIHKLFNKDCR